MDDQHDESLLTTWWFKPCLDTVLSPMVSSHGIHGCSVPKIRYSHIVSRKNPSFFPISDHCTMIVGQVYYTISYVATFLLMKKTIDHFVSGLAWLDHNYDGGQGSF